MCSVCVVCVCVRVCVRARMYRTESLSRKTLNTIYSKCPARGLSRSSGCCDSFSGNPRDFAINPGDSYSVGYSVYLTNCALPILSRSNQTVHGTRVLKAAVCRTHT